MVTHKRLSKKRSSIKRNSTTVILLPKHHRASKGRKRSSISRGRGKTPEVVKTEVTKVIKEAKKLEKDAPRSLQADMEKKITKELGENQVADLTVFKAVAVHMFKDPRFASIVEDKYGVTLDKVFSVYLRSIGIILEAVLGTWIAVAGVFQVSFNIVKFIYHIVYYVCIMTVAVVHKVAIVPMWLHKRILSRKGSRQSATEVQVVSS